MSNDPRVTDRIIVNGEDLTERVEQAAREGAINGSAWIPHARARIREGIICKLKLEGKSYAEIAAHPDVNMSVGGVFTALARIINRTLDPGDLRALLAKQQESINMRRELAMKIAIGDPARREATVFEKLNAMDRWSAADEAERTMLGLNAPKSIHISGIGSGNGNLPPPGSAIDIDQLKQIQELDPLLKPDDVTDEELCDPVADADPDDEQKQARDAMLMVEQSKDIIANELAERGREQNVNDNKDKKFSFKIFDV